MPTLTIATATLRRLVGLAAADTSADAGLVLIVAGEQAAAEYAIDPTTLATTDAGLVSLLTLGVSEWLAGTYLQQLARDPVPVAGAVAGPLKITAPTPAQWQALGDSLANKGTARLAPYLRRAVPVPASALLDPVTVDGIDPAPPSDPLLGPVSAEALAGTWWAGDELA